MLRRIRRAMRANGQLSVGSRLGLAYSAASLAMACSAAARHAPRPGARPRARHWFLLLSRRSPLLVDRFTAMAGFVPDVPAVPPEPDEGAASVAAAEEPGADDDGMVSEEQLGDSDETGAGRIYEHREPQGVKREGSPPLEPPPDSKVARSVAGLPVCQIEDFPVRGRGGLLRGVVRG